MQKRPLFNRRWVKGSAVVAATALSLAAAAPAYATPLASVKAATAQDSVVTVTFSDGSKDITGKITLLEDGIFRYNVDPAGEFSAYAKPKSADHIAKIQAQPDTSDKYTHPAASVKDENGKFIISAANGKTTIELDKATAKMTIKHDGKVVMEESAALDLEKGSTVQTLVKHQGENFFGGGTQNGRFIHTGKSINIANESNWVDGGVASPNPFYWSSKGYGVLRNTFADGSYDFGETKGDTTTALHKENELDAYYFVADAANGTSTAPIAQDLLQAYYKVTGNPILLPEYGFYTGTLNAWNRDMWSKDPKSGYSKKQIKGSAPASDPNAGETLYEKGGTGVRMEPNACVETLNGYGPTEQTENIPEGVTYNREFSAQHHLDTYVENDIPMGYFLPNDGYGSGYGQNGYGKTGGVNPDGSSSPERLAAIAANVQNLKEFSEYCKKFGVATGLWSQSYIFPDSNPATEWQVLRDFANEVRTGGVTTLKTDVAWVGHGYSMALDAVRSGYETVTTEVSKRPNIITLDGWAGTQRYGAVWTGDQSGGNWEYIRFHVPTFIGQSLAGNPNVGSDNDGIFGGAPIIATRDYQWKSFAPLMLDMDGWGTYVKAPQTHGDPYTGISRMYLKLKSQLMPYIYTTAASASNINTGNGDEGLPMVRAILLSEDTAYANSTATQYEYTLGEDFLVAPVYQNTDGDDANGGLGDGNDVRNGIYLPGTEKDIWIDYLSGKQYRGGQVLNNFEAPLWKLPVFVKANAIIPMWEANNNPEQVDRSIRNIEFFATDGENEYNLFEDTGTYCKNTVDTSDQEYGRESNIDYGPHVTTKFTSTADAAKKTATFKAGKSTGSYDGYKKDRTTTFIVNVSEEPESIVAKNGETVLTERKVDSQEAFESTVPAEGEVVTFYNTKPNLNYNTTAKSEKVRNEGFSKQQVNTTPKLYVKFAKTDVQANEQTLTLTGFANEGNLPSNDVVKELAAPKLKQPTEDDLTPTSIKLSWNKVEGATGYDIKIDGMVNAIPSGDTVEFKVTDLDYKSTHKFQIRTRSAKGVSEWSDPEITATTLEDPWRNCPEPASTQWEGGEQWGKLKLAFDHDDKNSAHFHSTGNVIGMPMTIDYGKVLKLDKFVYTPRQDNGGNGNVAKMKIETSLDGAHWVDHGVAEWDNTGADKMKQKTVNLEGSTARYLRLTVQESAGGFFSATELALYKVDKTDAQDPGSLKAPTTVGSEDYSHISNCVGRENRGTGKTDWTSHVAQSAADFNMNDAYDVYDMSFTMSKLDGGTKQQGKVAGSIAVVPSKTSVKAGETITVAVKAQGAKNVNAMGALVKYPVDSFEYVNDSLNTTSNAGDMENKSGHYTFGDAMNSVNIALANKGDKKLYNGSEDIATFQLTAKKDCEVSLEAEAWLVGPKQDFVTNDGSELGPQVLELGQDAFNITMTNEKLATDDGTNVEKLIQQKNYNGLFDDNESDNGFEFKWDVDSNHEGGKLPEYVMLPTTMHFELKEPRALQDVQVVNRDTYNGTVTSMEAVITYTDGSKSEFKGGDFATKQAVYTLKAEAGKLVQSVDIKPLTSEGEAKGYEGEAAKNRMLTLREINFNYVEGEVAPPAEEVKELAQDDFKITVTNKGYPTDDGTNVTKLVQQNNFDGLFNGNNTDRAFEFKWFLDVESFDDKVGLPANLGFELKQPRTLKNIELFNGDKGANGSINKLEAVVTFADDTTQEFKGGDYDTNQPTYVFEISAANAAKKVKKVEIKPMESTGVATGLENPNNRMLTIGEINFNYVDGADKPEQPEVDKSKLEAAAKEAGELKAADYTLATWTPFENALADAERLLADANATQGEVDQAVEALDAAHNDLVETEVPPAEQSSKQELEELAAKAGKFDTAGKTADSAKALAEAIANAKAVIADENASEAAIKAAYDQLKVAIDGLKDADGDQQPGDGNTGNTGNGNGGNAGNGGNGGNGGQNGTGNGGNAGNGGQNGTGSQGGKGKGGKGLPKTGDATAAIVLGSAAAGTLAIGGSVLIRRRTKGDQL
ncbi:MAG: hypothetical protein E7001_05415 [Coriobacteriaceae bacterium]|nr:hypothetical protein [Coriobacteriaceae bacterium]